MLNILAIILAMSIIYIPFSGDIEESLCKKIKGIITKFTKYRIILIAYFIIETVQQYLLFAASIHDILTQCLLTMTSLIIWGYLFSTFKEMKIDDKVILFILGSYQVAIYVTASSMECLDINIKLLFNFIYVSIPAFVILELSKPKKINMFKVIRILKQRLK
ncbi:hypothetical protein [Histophilus somni]|uniref:hypothetical protein n=1 Tax=Histophilus somni TaxID=731 RepID=UPI00201FB02C|nr:hypothetical protein [Histophilus somni]